MKSLLNFKRELDLVSAFNNYLKNGGLPTQARVVLEFESGHGIADIVIFGIDHSFTKRASKFAKIPPRYAVVFARNLLLKKFSSQQFSDITGSGLGASTRILNMLVKQETIRRLECGSYEITDKFLSPVGPIISIEAKLRDWRSALRQAYRYREFSNQSWVLLDTARILPALKQLQLFVRSGVGLASISTSGQLFIHHEPPATEPFSESRYWAACVQLTRQQMLEL